MTLEQMVARASMWPAFGMSNAAMNTEEIAIDNMTEMTVLSSVRPVIRTGAAFFAA